MKSIKHHVRNFSSHITKHHKKYLRGISWWLIVTTIIGFTWMISFVNQTSAKSSEGVKASNDRYIADISTTLIADANAGVLINDSNTRAGTLLSAALDSWPSHWSVVLNTDWSFAYSPDTGYNWSDSFLYHATNGVDPISVAEVNIQVGPPETPPVAWDNWYSLDENSSLTIDSDNGVLRNAYDNEWDPMTAILDRKPFNWEVTLNPDWSFTYTPDQYFARSDSFTYYLSDGKTTGNIATVWLSVNPIDDTYDINTVIVPETSNESEVETEFITKEYSTGNLALKAVTDPNTLIGNKRIKLTASNGQIHVPLVMQSVSPIDRVEVVIPAGTVAKNMWFGTNFTWTLNAPCMERLTLATEKWWLQDNIVSVASFGSNNGETSINFQDTESNDVDVLLRIPAPWLQPGSIAKIYYSNDAGYSWYEHDQNRYVNVIDIGWNPYVEVKSTHFTLFAIAGDTGSFVINNDDPSTLSDTVMLSIDLPVAAQMRFQNDSDVWTRSDRVNYDTSLSWTLSAWYGTKTVYAQFDTDGDGISDIETSDSIVYLQPWTWTCAWWSQLIWWVATACLHLEILGSSGHCTYGDTINFGIKNFNYNAQTYSTWFLTTWWDSARYCDDTEGKSSRNMTIQSNTIENDSNPARNIPASRVFIKNPAATKINGVCTPYIGDSNDIRQPLSWAVTILGKTSDLGEICKIQTDRVTMEIDALANQAIGTYSGTLTLSVPLP